MSTRQSRPVAHDLESLPPLPLDAAHWTEVCDAMELSPQQAKVVELVLRGAAHKEITAALGITVPTLKTYLERIGARTGTRGKMQLAMHVLAVSHQVRTAGVVQIDDAKSRRPKSRLQR